VVVDDIEDDLDPRPVQRADERLPLSDLASRSVSRAVRALRREEADRVVAPVIGEPLLAEKVTDEALVNGQELDGIHPELDQVWNLLDEPQIRPGHRRA
jgi:hypothetical protein